MGAVVAKTKSSEKFVFEHEAKDHGLLQFRTLDEVGAWLSAELDYWVWCTKPEPHLLGFLEDKRNAFLSRLTRAKKLCTQAAAASPDAQSNGWQDQLREYVQSGLVSRTARAQFVQSLRQGDQADIVASSALGIYLGSKLDPQSDRQPETMRYASFRGRTAMALFDLGVGADTTSAVANSTQSIAAEFTKQLTAQSEANSSLLDSLRASYEKIINDHAEAQATHGEKVTNAIDDVTKCKDEALQAMDDKRKAFNEFMKLKAPVEYWNQKAEEHHYASRWWLASLGIWAVLGSGALLYLFHTVYGVAANLVHATQPQTSTGSALIVLSAGAAVGTTIIFWVARFLSRLFLSERHMAIDAKLRSTLAQTYLAMTEEGKVSESDRALVLPALFRASSDGIVQEDTSIDGLVAMVARHLEKPRG
jgi:hypothetical protein